MNIIVVHTPFVSVFSTMDSIISDCMMNIVDFSENGIRVNKDLQKMSQDAFPHNSITLLPCEFANCKCLLFKGDNNKCTACGHDSKTHKKCTIGEHQMMVKENLQHVQAVMNDPCVICYQYSDEMRGPYENTDESSSCSCTVPICEECWIYHFNNGNDTCPFCLEKVGDWLFHF